MIFSTIPQLRRISPTDDFHYFFGYYDIPAFSQNDQLHLAHQVQFWDRWPRENDVAEIGIIERGKSTFTPLAQTTAWNFQQGAMLQWLGNSNSIIFNTRDKSTFGSCILNITTGEKYFYQMPIANVDQRGRFALGINFSRMFDFRPGYGYAGIVDPWQEIDHPEDDGVYLLDLQDGSTKLILSLHQIWEFTRQWLPEGNQKILINHLTLNPSGTRFVALVRYFPLPGEKHHTAVITGNIDGSDLRMMKPGYIVASHYHWKNDEVLMIYAAGAQGVRVYEWNDVDGSEVLFEADIFRHDGHCSYAPDRKSMVYDSYPDKERFQHLWIYDFKNAPVELGKLYSYPQDMEIRCDLHPRWNRDGSVITIDSNHEGARGIYELDLRSC